MPTRWRVLVAALAVLAVAGYAAYRFASDRDDGPGVTPANFARLRVGMSRAEAEAILGGPGRFLVRHTGNYRREYAGGGCTVVLHLSEFLPEEEVLDGTLHTPLGTSQLGQGEPTLFDALRRWLGL